MTPLQGLAFSPYIEDAQSAQKSAPEHCLVTFFEREDIEANVISFLPEQGVALVQAVGALAYENIALETVRHALG